MERLGVEDGDFIESKMVTRAVEKAQKKVENLHYEGRKQIVEYDDVANEQRKIVYKFRNELLNETYDIDSKINEIREEYLQHVLTQSNIFDDTSMEDENLTKLSKILEEELNYHIDLQSIKDLEYSDMVDFIYTDLKIYVMDNMKTGIRLRAYNQKDPLVEYKKESFNLFSELVEKILPIKYNKKESKMRLQCF